MMIWTLTLLVTKLIFFLQFLFYNRRNPEANGVEPLMERLVEGEKQ
jgi:hypothetical protein